VQLKLTNVNLHLIYLFIYYEIVHEYTIKKKTENTRN